MLQAGIQRVELDIHPGMVTFNTFHPAPDAPFGLAATTLPPDLPQPATRYLTTDQRDFVMVTLRAPLRAGIGNDAIPVGE
jgi:hypothetical protein